MDTQHRVFLEECRKLLDIANLTRSEVKIGAFAGCSVAWMFGGQGSQFAGMGAALRAQNPAFRKTFETCLAGFAANGLTDLDAVISDPARSADLDRTLCTQPALFSWKYAFATMLRASPLQPNLFFGHSVGEFAAAVTAVLLSRDDAIRLVAHRARLMEADTEAGAMLALSMPQAEIETIFQSHPGVAIAAINGPDRFSLSGRVGDIDALGADLTQQKNVHRRLGANRAFHSATMEAIKMPFRSACPAPSLEAPACAMLSTLTADLIEPAMLGADYW